MLRPLSLCCAQLIAHVGFSCVTIVDRTMNRAPTFLNFLSLIVVFVVLIPLQFFRARAEARVLEEHFGDQHRQYKARSWF
jgi:protein-S-isoprenylcysteine O-methyltransferase Ste14